MQTANTKDIDVSVALHIHQSRRTLTGLGLFFAVFALMFFASLGMAWYAAVEINWLVGLFAATGLAFALISTHMFRRAAQGKRVIVTLSPEGYRDATRHEDFIPWSDITHIKAVNGRGAHLRLSLSSEMGQKLRPGGLRRTLHKINNFSAGTVLATNPNLLEVRLQRLLEITQFYAAAHGGPRND